MNTSAVPVFDLTLAFALLLMGCSQEQKEAGPRLGQKPPAPNGAIYRIAVHPLHNPVKLLQTYQPLVEELNARLLEARLDLEASRDYGTFEKKYLARQPEFLLPNPWQTLQAMKVGYNVIAMAGEPGDFRGLLVARKGSGLKHPQDLKGKSVSYPSRTALAACIMPQYFLHENGINVNTDIENRYVGSQESSLMNVYLKQVALSATWPPPWRAFQKDHSQEAAELEVLWETSSLVNNSVMSRDDVPPPIVEQVRVLLIGMAETTKGRSILAGMETARFLPASNKDYDVVRRYIVRFESEVRSVEKR